MHKIVSFGKTDCGLKRTNNEDAFIVKPELGFCLVADGMGGAAAGELASRIFSETTLATFTHTDTRNSDPAERVQAAFGQANNQILQHVVQHPHHKGMGCTAELIAFDQNRFIVGHMGDSRTYRYKNRQLKQLTQDHSLVQDQLDRGLITPDEARNHSMRNVILRAVGIDTSPALDLVRGTIWPGDLFLLCSDGLTDMVEDHRIEEILGSGLSLTQKADALIDQAKSAGGHDNITVVLIEIV